MKILRLFLFLFLAFGCSKPAWHNLPLEAQKKQAAQTIAATFEKNLDQLSEEKQGHFLIRLYRLSGDEKYLPGIRRYADRLMLRLQNHAQNLDSPEYIRQTAEHFLKLPPNPLIKHRYRAKIRGQWPEMAFAHRLLFLAFQIKSFGLHKGALQADFEKIMQYLSKLSYADYVLNEDVIRYNSTRAVNMIYQLQFLGLEKHEEAFLEKFKIIFFSQPDQTLDRTVYLNKIYGLTHWVIAASDFYQHPVPYEKFRWVLNYFEENLDVLLVRNSPDTIAELAVCFKLAGQNNHPAVERIQKYLLGKFDPKKGYLPSDRKEFTPHQNALRKIKGYFLPKDGTQKSQILVHGAGFTLDAIEHRNILTYMALIDWEKLYAGPVLDDMIPAP